MTKVTTALITAGPRTIGPWGDRAWRVALMIQLVEGGSVPYFLPSPTVGALHQVSPLEVEIEAPDDEIVLGSLMMTLALQLGGTTCEEILLETHNISIEQEVRVVAPFWDLSSSTLQSLSNVLASNIRLGVTVLDPQSLATSALISNLRDLGFDVDLYIQDTQSRTAELRKTP